MRAIWLITAAATVTACTSKPCPDGATMTGAAPPEGTDQTCKKADGTKHGPEKVWFKSGQLQSVGAWHDGKRHGSWTYYHDNGVKSGEDSFKHGLPAGSFKNWYQNGNLKHDGSYKIEGGEFFQVGVHTEYGDNGKPKHICDHNHDPVVCKFANGGNKSIGSYKSAYVKTGLWTTWHESGNKKSQGTWTAPKAGCLPEEWGLCSRKTGEWTTWHENGKKESQGTYEEAPRDHYRLRKREKISLSAQSEEDCKPSKPIRHAGRVGLWRSWDESGLLTEEAEWNDGFRHGTVKSVDSRGNETTATYQSGVEHGKSVYRSADGSVLEEHFKNGMLHGLSTFTTYRSMTVTPYKNCKRHGVEVFHIKDRSTGDWQAVEETTYVDGVKQVGR